MPLDFPSWVDWKDIKLFFNSSFFTSIAGGFAGAWAGARIAQIVANRAKEIDDLRKEIGATNAATLLASSFCDDLAGRMSQHIKGLKEKYDIDREAVAAVLAIPRSQRGAPLAIEGDMRQLPGPTLSLEPLQRLVYEHPGSHEALKLFVALAESIVSLRDLIEKRNELLRDFKEMKDQEAMFLHRYFGFRDSMGRHDEEYRTVLQGMYVLSMDGIFFSMNLTTELSRHAENLCKKHKRLSRSNIPKAVKVDFSRLTERGLMPDIAEYDDWKILLTKTPQLSFWNKLVVRGKQILAFGR